MSKPLSVMWLGFRGFPNVEGGVETHAEQICPLLVEMGCEVHAICRAPYQAPAYRTAWRGVLFHCLWVPRIKGLEAFLHTFLGVLYAGLIKRPDILHIQAIGPALMTPLARLLGLKVVVTHHGPDYDRQKWGHFAKGLLRLGERLGMGWANERIVISKVIQQIVQTKYQLNSILIPNGVVVSDLTTGQEVLERFGLLAGHYALLVSRLVPEKRHLDLIAAFQEAGLSDWKLVLVGDLTHPDAYAQAVMKAAEQTPGVVCAGFLKGKPLAEMYTHAGLFVLPSSHEGLPITLLEALSYGLPVLASDIPANMEVQLPIEHYFTLGNVPALAAKLREFAACPVTQEAREARRDWVKQLYNWRDITRRTLGVYQTIA